MGTRILCLGLNYANTNRPRLDGCQSDASLMYLLLKRAYPQSVSCRWLDSQGPIASQGILRAIDWLLSGASEAQLCDPSISTFASWPLPPNSQLFLGYAGHGTQSAGVIDQLQEDLVGGIGLVSGEAIHTLLQTRMNSSSSFVGIVDCCQSATLVNLPYMLSDAGTITQDTDPQAQQTIPGNVLVMAACTDDESAYEVGIHGVFTTMISQALIAQRSWTFTSLIEAVRAKMTNYPQDPVFTYNNTNLTTFVLGNSPPLS